MGDDLRKLMDSLGLQSRSGSVKVIVVLNQKEASPECVQDLQNTGLEIDKIIGNHVVGLIDSQKLDRLRMHPWVREVEVSTRLRPNGPQRSQ